MENKLSAEIAKSKCLYVEQEKEQDSLSSIMDKFADGDLNKYEYILKMYKKYRTFFEVQPMMSPGRISSIKITPNRVIAQLEKRELSFSIDASCRSAIFEILNFGAYESEEMQMITSLMDKNGCFFDIGAHIGWYSINLASEYKQAQFFSFEPVPKTHSLLLENIHHNKLTNIKSFNFGFSDNCRTADFFYSEVRSAIASERDIFDTNSSKKIQCQLNTLDDFVKEQSIHRLDFIKCDVEGAEFLVLKGGKQTICKYLPMIFLELVENWCTKFGYNIETVIHYMSKIGYQMFEIKDGGLFEIKSVDIENVSNFNYLFLHKTNHSEQIERHRLFE